MNINEKIKQRGLQLGLNAKDVADALGISRATLYRYEGHDIEKLPISVLEPLAKILGTSPVELMGWEDSEFREQIVPTRFMFVIFNEDENNEYRLTRVKFWNLPEKGSTLPRETGRRADSFSLRRVPPPAQDW